MLWLVKEAFRPIYYCFTNPAFRKFTILTRHRGKSGVFSFNGNKVKYMEGASAAWQLREIFFDGSYDFKSDREQPVIIDCGANIGISALSFLTQFPKATLVAIEANPKIFELLENNLNTWSHSFPEANSKAFSAAAWTHSNGVEFAIGEADASSIHGSGEKMSVPSIRLRDLLLKYSSIDFLKIDIEGAEIPVLRDCAEELHRVKKLFVEYHSVNDREQELPELLQLLKNAGFRLYCETICGRKQPFIHQRGAGDFDLQMNIFANRP